MLPLLVHCERRLELEKGGSITLEVKGNTPHFQILNFEEIKKLKTKEIKILEKNGALYSVSL